MAHLGSRLQWIAIKVSEDFLCNVVQPSFGEQGNEVSLKHGFQVRVNMGVLRGIHATKSFLDECHLARLIEGLEQVEALISQFDILWTEHRVILQQGFTSAIMACCPEWILAWSLRATLGSQLESTIKSGLNRLAIAMRMSWNSMSDFSLISHQNKGLVSSI